MNLFARFALIACAALALPAHAETFVVTRFDDPVEDACLPGDCSLREAASAASSNDPFAGADRIELGAGSYTLVRGPLRRPNADLELVGAGSAQTRIDTDAELFDLANSSTLSIQGITVATTDFNVLTMGASSAAGQLLLDDVVVPIGGGTVQGYGSDGFEVSLQVRDSELRDNVQCNMREGSCTLIGSTLNALNVNPGDTPGPSVRLIGSVVDGSQDQDGLLTGIVLHHAAIVELTDSTIVNTSNGLKRAGDYADPITFRLLRVTYADNSVPFRPFDVADVRIEDSVFRDNPTRAIYVEGDSTWSISGSSFVNNKVDGNAGGAIVIEDAATVSIENSTFSANSFSVDAAADGARGAAIGWRNGSGARLDLRHVTIARPTVMPVGIEGTAIGGQGGSGQITVNLGNSILAGSCRFEAGALHHNAGNVESPGTTCGLDEADNQVSVSSAELALGSLGDHGGATPSYLPGAESVAIDMADMGTCADVDQRGYPRPFGGACDSGAIEAGADDALFADGFD